MIVCVQMCDCLEIEWLPHFTCQTAASVVLVWSKYVYRLTELPVLALLILQHFIDEQLESPRLYTGTGTPQQPACESSE